MGVISNRYLIQLAAVIAKFPVLNKAEIDPDENKNPRERGFRT